MAKSSPSLRTMHKEYERWRGESRTLADARPPSEFEKWTEYANAFVGFLQENPVAHWDTRDTRLIAKIVRRDLGSFSLLRNMQLKELTKLLLKPYPEQTIRSYMLSYAKEIDNQAWQIKIAEHFLNHDDAVIVRSEALKILASLNWNGLAQEITAWWQSEDSTDRMVALDCLRLAKSERLPHFLAIAKEDADANLRRFAQGIETILRLPDTFEA